MNDIEEDALREFVVAAHRNGYAAADADETEDGPGKTLEYGEGSWRYVDRYVGSREFLGMEIVQRAGRPLWGMHYHGAPTIDEVDHDTMYDFLGDALGAVSADDPYRGPDGFADGSRVYHCDVTGSLERFDGRETITVADDVVYRGRFAGGCID